MDVLRLVATSTSRDGTISGPVVVLTPDGAVAAQAQAASSSHSLMVETLGKVWLFTLGQQTQPSRGGTKVVEVGPLAKVEAGEYLLRVNEGHGPPGGRRPCIRTLVQKHSTCLRVN